LIQVPDDKSINPHGLMNEGIVSTQLGLPGKPMLAEELIVARDIKLARYADSRLHLTGISSGKSLEYIRRAKEGNIEITCSVTPYHLFFCDEDLASYDTNLKVNPPLRRKEDRAALQQGVSDGTIDCIASHHLPHEYDSKVLEFEYAKNGMISLETSYAALNTAMPDIAQERWVELLSINPREVFGLDAITIRENATASLTLFNPGEEWTFEAKHIHSKSKNSPFVGRKLKGRVVGIINKSQTNIN
jgi:dihydroorotase